MALVPVTNTWFQNLPQHPPKINCSGHKDSSLLGLWPSLWRETLVGLCKLDLTIGLGLLKGLINSTEWVTFSS